MKKFLPVCAVLSLLASCASTESPRMTNEATPEQIAAQIREYNAQSDTLVQAVQAAFAPGATAQSIGAINLSPQNKATLEELRVEAIRRFPELMKKTAWLAESSQLVGVNESKMVVNNLEGLFVIATTANDDPTKTAWLLTLTVDMSQKKLIKARFNNQLTSGYIPPTMKNIGADGKMPLIRRTYSVNSPDITVQNVNRMDTPAEPEAGVLVYDANGVLQH